MSESLVFTVQDQQVPAELECQIRLRTSDDAVLGNLYALCAKLDTPGIVAVQIILVGYHLDKGKKLPDVFMRRRRVICLHCIFQ